MLFSEYIFPVEELKGIVIFCSGCEEAPFGAVVGSLVVNMVFDDSYLHPFAYLNLLFGECFAKKGNLNPSSINWKNTFMKLLF